LLSEMLNLLDPKDEECGYVQLEFGDEVVSLINNFGGLSSLATSALIYQTMEALRKDCTIKPARVFYGIFESSLDAVGFSITLLQYVEGCISIVHCYYYP
ncbi:Dak kinase, partial [Lipomyces doorenjongii]|uniref:Dak kinase n=1 Tax=Lipomyces doorenjongii TaxID=383834 RepID=UPI0034CFF498